MLKFKFVAEKSFVLGEKDELAWMYVNPEQIARVDLHQDGRCFVKMRNSELREVIGVTEEDLDLVASKYF